MAPSKVRLVGKYKVPVGYVCPGCRQRLKDSEAFFDNGRHWHLACWRVREYVRLKVGPAHRERRHGSCGSD
jgi:hypothetical protein